MRPTGSGPHAETRLLPFVLFSERGTCDLGLCGAQIRGLGAPACSVFLFNLLAVQAFARCLWAKGVPLAKFRDDSPNVLKGCRVISFLSKL